MACSCCRHTKQSLGLQIVQINFTLPFAQNHSCANCVMAQQHVQRHRYYMEHFRSSDTPSTQGRQTIRYYLAYGKLHIKHSLPNQYIIWDKTRGCHPWGVTTAFIWSPLKAQSVSLIWSSCSMRRDGVLQQHCSHLFHNLFVFQNQCTCDTFAG